MPTQDAHAHAPAPASASSASLFSGGASNEKKPRTLKDILQDPPVLPDSKIQEAFDLLKLQLLSLMAEMPDDVKVMVSFDHEKISQMTPESLIEFSHLYQAIIETIFLESRLFKLESSLNLSADAVDQLHTMLIDLSNFSIFNYTKASGNFNIKSMLSGDQRQAGKTTQFFLLHQFSSFYSLVIKVFQVMPLEKVQGILGEKSIEWFKDQLSCLKWETYLRSKLFNQQPIQWHENIRRSGEFDVLKVEPGYLSQKDTFIKLAHMLFVLAAGEMNTQTSFEKVYEVVGPNPHNSAEPALMLEHDLDIERYMPLFCYKIEVIDCWRVVTSEVQNLQLVSLKIRSSWSSVIEIKNEIIRVLNRIATTVKYQSLFLKAEKMIQIRSLKPKVSNLFRSISNYSDFLSKASDCFSERRSLEEHAEPALVSGDPVYSIIQSIEQSIENSFQQISRQKLDQAYLLFKSIQESPEENDAEESDAEESDAEKSPPASPSR